MGDSITFNKKKSKYGPLSVYFREPLELEGEVWKNVATFVWAGLLCHPYTSMLRNHESGFPLFVRAMKNVTDESLEDASVFDDEEEQLIKERDDILKISEFLNSRIPPENVEDILDSLKESSFPFSDKLYSDIMEINFEDEENLTQIKQAVSRHLTRRERQIRTKKSSGGATKSGVLDKQRERTRKLKKKWAELPQNERRKYFRDPLASFSNYFNICTLRRNTEFFSLAYQKLLEQNPNLSSFLIGTYPKKLIYIDPMNLKNPLFGVGFNAGGLPRSKPNVVGDVLMTLRKDFRSKKIQENEEQVAEIALIERGKFVAVFNFLENLMKSQDIKEFLDKPIDDIITMIRNAVRVSFGKRTQILFLPEGLFSSDETSMTPLVNRSSIEQAVAKELLRKGEKQIPEDLVVRPANLRLGEKQKEIIDFYFSNNRNDVSQIFNYDMCFPGSLPHHIRKLNIKDLYGKALESEKRAIAQGVLEFIILADPEERISKEHAKEAAILELRKAENENRLLDAIDDLDQAENLHLLLPKKQSGRIQGMDISDFVNEHVEKERRLGNLIQRISYSNDVLPALEWSMSKCSEIDAYLDDKIPQGEKVSEEIFSQPMDSLAAKIVSSLRDEEESSLSRVEQKIMMGDIVFQSNPGKYDANFPLSPSTPNLLLLKEKIFPSVFHAVIFLWFTKIFGLTEEYAYKSLLTIEGKDDLVELAEVDILSWENLPELLVPEDYGTRVLNKMNRRFEPSHGGLFSAIFHLHAENFPLSIEGVENFFLSWEDLMQKWDKTFEKYILEVYSERLEMANAKKFKSSELRQLLLETWERKLIEDDPTEEFFNQQAGESLMKIRDDIAAEIVTNFGENKQSENISRFVNFVENRLKKINSLSDFLEKIFVNDPGVVSIILETIILLYRGEFGFRKLSSPLLDAKLESIKGKSDLDSDLTDILVNSLMNLFTESISGTTTKEFFLHKSPRIGKAATLKAEEIFATILHCIRRELGLRITDKQILEVAKFFLENDEQSVLLLTKLQDAPLSEELLDKVVSGKLDYFKIQKLLASR